MQTTRQNIILYTLTTLLMLVLIGCSGNSNSNLSATASGTGSATVKLIWPEAVKSTATKSVPAPISLKTIRVIINLNDGSGDSMTQDFDYADKAGIITGIPVGPAHIFHFYALDSEDRLVFGAMRDNVAITAGETTDLGEIIMGVAAIVTPQALTVEMSSETVVAYSWLWSAMSFDVSDYFYIERKTGSDGEWTEFRQSFPVENQIYYTYTDATVEAGKTYYYRVKMVTSRGNSAWSNIASTEPASAAPYQIPKTGQTTSYAAGDDGDLQKGVAVAGARFTDNNDGTVTDNLTGLVWLKVMNCFGVKNWQDALNSANSLMAGECGLSDGSVAGDWRLPNIVELESLVDLGVDSLAIDHTAPFFADPNNGGVTSGFWSSTTFFELKSLAWVMGFMNGTNGGFDKSMSTIVWPVRDSKTAITPPVQLPKTGQSTCYDAAGNEIACAGTGQDGDKQKGVAAQGDRFTDNADGTVTDNLTGLVWLKDANCYGTLTEVSGYDGDGFMTWGDALLFSNTLASGIGCGLTDGSVAGDWRLPNRKELLSLVDYSRFSRALPAWHPFVNVANESYWSSSHTADPSEAWGFSPYNGGMEYWGVLNNIRTWPVRDAK